MKSYLLRTRERADVIARVLRAETIVERTIGLLLEKSVPPGTGIWLDDCASIHTLFMRASIDVMFVGGDGCVRKIVSDVRPNVFALTDLGASATIELGAGTIARAKVRVGDYLALEPAR